MLALSHQCQCKGAKFTFIREERLSRNRCIVYMASFDEKSPVVFLPVLFFKQVFMICKCNVLLLHFTVYSICSLELTFTQN